MKTILSQSSWIAYCLPATAYFVFKQIFFIIISLFVHLLVPFIVNICSALLIIVGTARQRSAVRKKQPLKEHKQLLISPLILFLLALPRLIISLLSGCVDPS